MSDAAEKRRVDAVAQAGDRRVEQIVRERVAVFAGRQAMAQPEHGDAVRRRPEQPEHGAGRIDAREHPFVDALLNVLLDLVAELAHRAEPLPIAADARHGAVDENQRKIFGLFLAEGIEPPERLADPFERRVGVRRCRAVRADKLQPFLGKREENVFLAREVAVDRAWAIFNLFGDLAHRHVRVALVEEERPRGVQNLPPYRFAFPTLTLSMPISPLTRNRTLQRASDSAAFGHDDH